MRSCCRAVESGLETLALQVPAATTLVHTCVHCLDQLKAAQPAGLAHCCQLLQDLRLGCRVLDQLLHSTGEQHQNGGGLSAH